MAVIWTNGRPAVLLDAGVCLWLWRYGGVPTLISLTRNVMPRVCAQLCEIRDAAKALESGSGQPDAASQAAPVSVLGQLLGDLDDGAALSKWLMSAQDAAAELGIDPRSVRRRADRGHLIGVKIGSEWIVTRASVDQARRRAA